MANMADQIYSIPLQSAIWVSDQVLHKLACEATRKMARSLKFRIRKKRNCTIRVAKTKALISL